MNLGCNGKKVKMAAARAGVLGVRWLQKAARNMVPMGARTASHITKDMLPGPYPKTPEERAAAASSSIICGWKTTSRTQMMAWGMVTIRNCLTAHSRRGIHGTTGTTQTCG